MPSDYEQVREPSNGTPWEKRGIELWDKEGVYSDYVAWREWIQEALGPDDIDSIIPDALEQITIYGIMHKACNHAFAAGRQCADEPIIVPAK
jgi:hypothetical protein